MKKNRKSSSVVPSPAKPKPKKKVVWLYHIANYYSGMQSVFDSSAGEIPCERLIVLTRKQRPFPRRRRHPSRRKH
jgi:hypothetical protein